LRVERGAAKALLAALALAVAAAMLATLERADARALSAAQLGVVYNLDDASSERIAKLYAARRLVPAENLVGIHLLRSPRMEIAELERARAEVMRQLPVATEALLLVWSEPYAAGCMSVTSAFTAGYAPEFCEPGCAPTRMSPLYDSAGWDAYPAWGWRPAMLLPADDEELARALIDRGVRADGTHPTGTVYLIRTGDKARSVRAPRFPLVQAELGRSIGIVQLLTPVLGDVPSVLGYFTGVVRVEEINRLHFIPGGMADHLTSTGGVLDGTSQMSALEWLRQGATASYGTVSEPCNHLGKFPDPLVLLRHYTAGDTILQAYWKSVAMPGQGLFVGEPLARPFSMR
jgi:uncharacterized protein (TIGR03790 family)